MLLGIIYFHYADTSLKIKKVKELKQNILLLFKEEAFEISRIDYIFCSDAYLLEINNKFLGHDFYTDIITFSLDDTPGARCGEIYISLERVKENARLFKEIIQSELSRVIFHGALHLCGFKDKKKADKAEMTARENFYLDFFKVPRKTVSE